MSAAAQLWTRRVCVALAIAWIALLLVAFVLRIGFPLELEWMEGGVLHQAHRLQHGEPIYPPPSRDFVPFLYTPGYPAVLAGLGSLFALDYALGRLVSIVSCVAIGWAVWRAVGREGKPRSHRAMAVGLFCSGYVFTFRWLDLARPDALYMALTLWGLVLLREAWGDHRKAVAAGVLIALGFWTKQTAATFIVASGVGALLVAPRQLWSYTLTVAVIDGGGVLLGNAVTDGWLWHYIYELHQQHAFNRERFTTKTWGMFLHAAPFVVLLAILGLSHFFAPWLSQQRKVDPEGEERRRRRLIAGKGLLYWALMAAAGLLSSALGYATQWAEPNAFIPGVVMGAIFVGVALPQRGWGEVVGLALACAQMFYAFAVEPMYQPIQDRGLAGLSSSFAWQDPSRTIPDANAWARAEERRAMLESADGEVFALQRPWWSILAGGEGHVGSMGLNDVEPERRAEVEAALLAELRHGRFAQIWLDSEPPRWMLSALQSYRVERRFHGEERVRPMSGFMSDAGMVTPHRADQLLLVPIAPREPPLGGTVIADFEDGTIQGFAIEGRAFGRRPVRGQAGRLPPVGPYGGEYLLSSAGASGEPKLTGTATSPAFTLPSAGRLEALVGTTGRAQRLAVVLLDDGGDREVELPIPSTRLQLASLRWPIPAEWAGASVRLRLTDESTDAALFVDDVWIVAE
jgi:hypothetical protein